MIWLSSSELENERPRFSTIWEDIITHQAQRKLQLTPSIFNSSDSAVELGPRNFAHQASSHSVRVENGAHSLGVSSSV